MSENTDTPTVHWQVYIGTMTKQAVILEAFIHWLPFYNTTDVLATMTHYTSGCATDCTANILPWGGK